jgi:putative endonuclease
MYLCACHGAQGRRSLSKLPGLERKRLAWRFGRLGEAICSWRLRLSGYRVIARNVRTPFGELDLVARRGGTIAFIEVKARAGDDAIEALMPRQQRRIVRAAEMFLADKPSAAVDVRFDVMIIGRRLLPKHLPAAFRADD